MAPPRTVASIVGHRQVEMAIACLGSLLRYSADELRLRLHDDGSLTAEDRERLAAALREPEVVSRLEADERTGEFLARHPALRAFRRGNVMALKLVDAMLFAGDELAYCDSDILFLRPFSRLYSLDGTAAGALFMSDRQNAYALRSWHLVRHPGLRLPQRLNAGITFFRAAGFDLDLLEWYVAQAPFQFAPVWMEQTAWGLLAARVGCRLLDPAQVSIPAPARKYRRRWWPSTSSPPCALFWRIGWSGLRPERRSPSSCAACRPAAAAPRTWRSPRPGGCWAG